jgi:transposase
MIAGTSSDKVCEVLNKIPIKQRNKVLEITLDMAGSMNLIAKKCFPRATLVTDRFHVQKLANEAVQDIRIKHRWEAIDNENEAIEKARKNKKAYQPVLLENGDTVKQLLARSRYVLFKNQNKWTENQAKRAEILFDLFPDIHEAYQLSQKLNWIFENTTDKIYGYTRLAQSGFKSFNTISRTIMNHYKTILNYFDNRSTNASAESFNAKIKAFRSQFRGVRNVEYFLFRLTQIYA